MRDHELPFWLRVILSITGETFTRLIIPALFLGWAVGQSEAVRQSRYAIIDPERAVFGDNGCGNPCIMNESRGGIVLAFTNMAAIIVAEHRMLVINGRCPSACAIMADLARPFVCITPRASFHFHKGFIRTPEGVVARFDPYSSEDVWRWINVRGGFPYDDFLDMEFREARQFWEVCTLKGKGGRIARM